MPHLIEPSADPHLRMSFLEAMREFEAETGQADAGGLAVQDLEQPTCLTHYTAGLRHGTSMRPGTEPLRCCEWWWVDSGPDGPIYLGRVALTHHPAPGQSHLKVSVRPSRRRQGHGSAILSSALPLARAHGIDRVRFAVDETDIAARKVIEKCGCHLEQQQNGRRTYVWSS